MAMKSRIWLIADDEFKKMVAESNSVSSILRKIGISKSGFNTVMARIERDELDTSHFGSVSKYGRIPLGKILVKHSSYSRYHLKNRLLKDNILENKCLICGLNPIWQDKPLVLILDHKNGIRDDNRRENLRFICPNCNSQTDTFSGRNNR